MSEKYPGWSSYNYTLTNPMRYIDPKGLAHEDPDQEAFDELYYWLANGGEGFPGNNDGGDEKEKKQISFPGTERNQLDQPTALEIINRLGDEFKEAFKKAD